MNTTFYLAIRTIPLGIAVTIEYLGPLAVAIIGSRGRLDLLWAALAGLGVALLGFRPVSLDPVGLALVLVAACCWAGYIVLGARARQYWRGSDLVTIACASGALMLAVPAIHVAGCCPTGSTSSRWGASHRTSSAFCRRWLRPRPRWRAGFCWVSCWAPPTGWRWLRSRWRRPVRRSPRARVSTTGWVAPPRAIARTDCSRARNPKPRAIYRAQPQILGAGSPGGTGAPG